METKALTIEMKDEAKGIVTARFATLGVKDRHGDIIEQGAFGNQKVSMSAYGHASHGGALPVGVGTIHEKGDEAIGELQMFLDTTHGRDHFETIKGLGDLGEWSFGFDVVEAGMPSEEQRQAGVERVLKKLRVIEVSPVLQGAGVNTATLAVKALTPATSPEAQARDAQWLKALSAAVEGLKEVEEKGADDEPANKKDEAEKPAEPTLKEQIAREVGRFEALKREIAER